MGLDFGGIELGAADVEDVLRKHAARVVDSRGQALQLLAEAIFGNWGEEDRCRVEAAAHLCDSIAAQSAAADAEIYAILIEQGILTRDC